MQTPRTIRGIALICITTITLACDAASTPTGTSSDTSGSTGTTSDKGTISYAIRDASGALIAGADLELDYTLGSAPFKATSNSGSGTISNVPNGAFTLTAFKSGYTHKAAFGTVVGGQTVSTTVTMASAAPTAGLTGAAGNSMTVYGVNTGNACAVISTGNNSIYVVGRWANTGTKLYIAFPKNWLVARPGSVPIGEDFTGNDIPAQAYADYHGPSNVDYLSHSSDDRTQWGVKGPGTGTLTVTGYTGTTVSGTYAVHVYDGFSSDRQDISGSFTVAQSTSCSP